MSHQEKEFKAVDVNLYRKVGKMLSETIGSDHYNVSDVQPIELISSIGYLEGFALGGAIKYTSRFKQTNNKKDLIKAIDMLQIYLGYLEVETTKQTITEEVKKCGYQDKTSPMK